MSKKIKIMKDMLANKIAAGEIIERPLSVVKELVENSLDAEAKRIIITLKSSGLEYISVLDDGHGMEKDDLELTIKRHATSKIYSEDDLFKISTLGFRGEAIPSIYSVSKMTITTSVDGETGWKLVKNEDETSNVENAAMNKGTKVEVEHLFYNTPVRYKHLSSPFYELSLIIQYINKAAIIHSDISFTLINDNNELIKTTGDNNPINIFVSQYNADIASRMITAKGANEHFKIKIYTSHPQDTRSRRSHITIAMNKRLVRSYEIENQIVKSYSKFLHTNQYPITFIDIEVKFELVDVNVHPTKQQVKVSLIEELLKLIDDTVKEQLAKLMYISMPKDVMTSNQVADRGENLFTQKKVQEDESVTLKEIDKVLYNKNKEKPQELKEQPRLYSNSSENTVDNEGKQAEFTEDELRKTHKINSDNISYTEDLFSYNEFTDEYVKLPKLDYIGTFKNTYLLFQNESGLYLIDQHAAQERINYELIFTKFKEKKFEYQNLLLPTIIELTNSENEIFKNKYEQIKNFGIELEPFGINTYKVVEADSFIASRDSFEYDIKEMITKIIENKEQSYAKHYEELAISMACKKSVKANQYLNKSEAFDLLRTLDKTNEPYTCPHGRPVIVNLTLKEIEKMFKRIM